MNSSASAHEAHAPARLADATISARAAEPPPAAGCPGATLRDHFPRRRLTAPAPGSPTMAAVVARNAGVS